MNCYLLLFGGEMNHNLLIDPAKASRSVAAVSMYRVSFRLGVRTPPPPSTPIQKAQSSKVEIFMLFLSGKNCCSLLAPPPPPQPNITIDIICFWFDSTD